MDAPLLTAQRLRVTRTPAAMSDNASPIYPQAGPSRHPAAPLVDLTNDREKIDEDEDTQATPRIPISASLPPTQHHDNPAARLRALLARVPNFPNNNTSAPPPRSSSERESDFEAPDSGPDTPSVARESLKELFSRVLHHPSDPPPKHRRRNSIDTSVIESTPRLPRSEGERSKGKHKRASLSDEEVDRLSKYQQESQSSAKPNSAAAYDSLRAKLDRFRAVATSSRHRPKDAPSDASDVAADTTDTASLLRELDSPPAATSTPLHSMQMPSQIQLHSNLLEGDSEMQRAMNHSDSYEGDSRPSERPPFPPPRQPTPSRPPSRLPHLRSPSHDDIAKKGSNTLPAQEPSRTPSRMRTVPPATDLDREREWNRHHGKTQTPRPVSWAAGELSHSSSHSSETSLRGTLKRKDSASSISQKASSPVNGLSRRGSSASLLSSDGVPSHLTRKSSSASLRHVDGRASVIGIRRDSGASQKAAEAERNWNKPRPRLSSANLKLHQSSSSSSGPTSRVRTQSFPIRPDSAQSTHSIQSSQSSYSQIPAMRLPRNQRRTSSITSAGSSVGSLEVEEEEEEEEVKEVLHERERNWNSPHPKWEVSRRSSSPHPPSRPTSPMPSPSPTHPRFSLNFRRRTESLGIIKHVTPEENEEKTAPTKTPVKKPPLRSAASHSGLPIKAHSPRSPSSPNLRANSGSQSPSYLGMDSKHASHIPRPKSPIPSPQTRAKSNPELSKADQRSTKLPSYKSPSSFQFPSRNRAPLPPLEMGDEDEEAAHSAEEISVSVEAPEEPVDQFRSVEEVPEPTRDSNAAHRRGHRRSLTEFSEAIGCIPPAVKAVPFPGERNDEVFTSDKEGLPATSTPTIRSSLALASSVNDRPEQPANETQRSQREFMSLEIAPVTPPASPPATNEPFLSLVTPPRPQAFTPPRVNQGTPSPMKDIPELPGPPSSSEDETEGAQNFTPERPPNNGNSINFSMMKTPRPPGAWAATPIPPSRAQSLPDVSQGEETETEQNGHATPMVSLSRAATLPLQTPAPPGAWMNTPASSRPKSILKVRFDIETSGSEISQGAEQSNGNGIPAPQFKLEDPSDDISYQHRREPAENGSGVAEVPTDIEDEQLETPRFSPQRLRKSPSIRILDAFGREATQDEAAVKEEESDQELSVGQRSKGSVRIVDAMGREIHESIEDQTGSSSSDSSLPLTRGQALTRVRETIAELRDGFNDAERSQGELSVYDNRVEELERISRTARDARGKLVRSMSMVGSADPELRSRLGLLKESMRRNRFLPSVINEGGRRLPSLWAVACFILLQTILIFIMYKVSTLRARRIFLTTYYDPFYPDLHLHIIKPDTLHYQSVTTHNSWSLFAIPDAIERGGWSAAFSEMWGNMSLAVGTLHRQTWEVWGGDYNPLAWPPT